MEIITLYDNYDYSRHSFSVACYKINELGFNLGDATLWLCNQGTLKDSLEIVNMDTEILDLEGQDFWMITDAHKKFMFLSYGA